MMANQEEVEQFYLSNWAKIIYGYVRYGESEIYNRFVSTVTYEPVRKLVRPSDSQYSLEFLNHLMDGEITPLDYRTAIVNQVDVENIHKKFWYHPKNMELAAKMTLPLPKPYSELGKKHARIIKHLTSIAYPGNMFRPAWSIQSEGVPQTSMPMSSINTYGQHMGVTFANRWYLGSLMLQIRNWWFNLNIQRFSITDNFTNTKLGDMYLVITDKMHSHTLPLGKGVSLVITEKNFNMVHECVHAVQYAYENFWDIPRDLVEIPAMALENKARNDYNCLFPKEQMYKQVALALADLTTDNPEAFNTAYEKYYKVTDAGHIRARMPHVVTNPQTYYGYILGLSHKIDIEMLPLAVRDHNYVEKMFT